MDIANIFSSKTRKALFQLYFSNPDNEYYLRQLERILNIPVSMIRKELLRLEKDGVFISAKKGNLVYYSLNKSYALFDELKSIVFKTVGVKGLLKKRLNAINGAEVAFIYGSFAKNEENANSDIDLFIIGKIDEDRLAREMNSLEKILKREINYSLYTRKDFREKKKENDAFILELLENPKVFLIGEKHEL
jgi:predicted nucleotidyltransferase